MNSYVCDTHTLVWHITKDAHLGQKARQILNSADDGRSIVIVPTIVLAELIYIIEKGRINLDLDNLLEQLKESKNYIIVPLDFTAINEVRKTKVPELHDRIITATARLLNIPVLTKDPHIQRAVPTLWD